MNLQLTVRLRRIPRGALKYGPLFIAEVCIFWLIVVAVNLSGYGTPSSSSAESHWWPVASLGLVALAMGAGEARFHLYRRVWSTASLQDAFAIGLAVTEATLLVTIVNLLIPDGYRPLRLLAPVFAAPAVVIGVGLLRLLPRLLTSPRAAGNRLLVVIPDMSGYSTVKTLLQQRSPDWTPVAVVTTGTAEVGRTIMGVPVLGTTANLRRWIKETDAQGVAFVQGRAADRANARSLYSEALRAELPVFIMPASEEWFPRPSGARLRQLSADDLVGRDEREINLELAASEIRDHVVLVTGAAGSIGSEICRLVAAMGPRRLVLVDINESGLFDLAEELRVDGTLDLREALVSITDQDDLLSLFGEERPDIVFHAAAYKHVPMLESHPSQAVMTNVIGTRNTLRCSDAVGVKKFILISTDKAASKHSVMGCTKRLCEQLSLAYRGAMVCWAVRFGNVVGSRGSVVPLFERQIEHGGPVTITHPEVSRYMMTIREAASLVISSLTMGRASHLYMLDMGEPIKIYDLAKDLIRSRGMRPGVDIKVAFTGLRPGERMTEDLLAPDEGWRPTSHPAIREVISPMTARAEDLAWTVERLAGLAREGKSDELVRGLKMAVQVPLSPSEEPDVPSPRPSESRTKEKGQQDKA
ncbi:MAG TPA: polysaccharide biosynthesis protein [Candidatus Dormibacteraeota bacterium]|nr:polysaccharide biosynthesis protein [Candidatus Dormibacteraeota bacterium]